MNKISFLAPNTVVISEPLDYLERLVAIAFVTLGYQVFILN